MKTKEMIPHGEVGHLCHGGCAGYAKGGRIPEQHMDARARNREELGLPATEGGMSTIIDQIPWIGLAKKLGERADANERLANPALLHNTAGNALGTNLQRGGPMDKFGKEADVQMLFEGGEVEDHGEGPMVGKEEDDDPSVIPEDIKEFVNQQHKAQRESRPDESWRMVTQDKKEPVASYKRDEEDIKAAQEDHGEGDSTSGAPHYDEGGPVTMDPNQDLQDLAPAGAGTIAPSPAQPIQPPEPPPVAVAPSAPTTPPPMPKPMALPAAPASTDQDFMDKANKMMGLNPNEQAAFMKLLGNNAQKGQIGAGIAGIGDAIASGGTLGKVNPGGLNRSEDILQNKTKEGIEGMQTIRGNQEKAAEMADKLEARDPKSPLSRYAQKAYAGIGKKLGLDLSNASASLIADVSGKGVEALNTEYQNQLKMAGLNLQKQQVEATTANQKAERREAEATRAADAAKTLAGQGLIRKGLNQITPSGRTAQTTLQNEAAGVKTFNSVEEAEGAGLPVGTRVSIGGRMATIK